MSNVVNVNMKPVTDAMPRIVELASESIGALRLLQACMNADYHLGSIRVFTRDNVAVATDGHKFFHVRGIFDASALRALPWDEIGLVFDRKVPKGFDRGHLDMESRRLTVASDRKVTEIPFQLVVEDDLERFPDCMRVLEAVRVRPTDKLAFNASFLASIADAIAWKTGKEYRDPVIQVLPNGESRAFEVCVPRPLMPFDYRLIVMPCRV